MYYAYVFHGCINKLRKTSTEFSRDILFKEGNFDIAYYVFCGDSCRHNSSTKCQCAGSEMIVKPYF